jgi:hypothetical protein
VRTARSLLWLYPPAWRSRYGEEFVATLGAGPLRAMQVFDIVMAAIDAWLSSEVRDATRAYRAAGEGGLPMLKSMKVCGRSTAGVTPRDGLIGAGVMLLLTFAFSLGGIAARRAGWPATAEALQGLAFPVPFVLSMPWWLMKGQPRKAQAAIIGMTLTILVVLSCLAARG